MTTRRSLLAMLGAAVAGIGRAYPPVQSSRSRAANHPAGRSPRDSRILRGKPAFANRLSMVNQTPRLPSLRSWAAVWPLSMTTTTAGWTCSCSAEPASPGRRALRTVVQEQPRWHFHRCNRPSGLVRTGWTSAVTVGDYSNDGFDDLFITSYGHNVLYRHNGDGTFTDVTERAGFGRLRPLSMRWVP